MALAACLEYFRKVTAKKSHRKSELSTKKLCVTLVRSSLSKSCRCNYYTLKWGSSKYCETKNNQHVNR